MFKRTLLKLKNINLIDLFKTYLKKFIINGVNMVVTYQISIFLLGYCVLTPVFVRILNFTLKNNVAECWSIFELPQQQPTFSGLTWNELIIGGIVFGTVFFGLNTAKNYFTESIYPPLMRSMGYDYYTLNEKNALLLEKTTTLIEQNRLAARVIDQQSRVINALQSDITNIDENLKIVHSYLTDTTEGSLLHKVRFEFNVVYASVNEVRNNILDMQRNQLRLIQEKLMVLERNLGNVSSMTSDLANRPIPNYREDLSEITSMFRDFQGNILGTLSEPINMLRSQVLALETFEPNELHTVTDRLRQTLGAFEHLAGQVQASGANIEAAMQNTVERIEEYESQVVLPENSTVINARAGASDVPNNVPTEAFVGGMEATRQNIDNVGTGYNANSSVRSATTTRSRTLSESSSTEVTQIFNRPTTGSYRIEQQGDELLIRLSLKGVNVPISEMASNPALTPVRRVVSGTLNEVAVNGLVSLASNYGPRLAMGAVQGMLLSMGVNPFYRSLTNSTPDVAEAEQKIETFVTGAKVGLKALTNFILK